jgi:hypothetical protein
MEDTVFHQLFAALQHMDCAKLRSTDANERPWTVAFQVPTCGLLPSPLFC